MPHAAEVYDDLVGDIRSVEALPENRPHVTELADAFDRLAADFHRGAERARAGDLAGAQSAAEDAYFSRDGAFQVAGAMGLYVCSYEDRD